METSKIGIQFSPRTHKWLFLGALVLVVAQQIYFPQALKYFHLALLFVFMAFNDMREYSTRNLDVEMGFLSGIMISAATSVVESVFNQNLSWLYAVAMAVSGTMAILYFLDLHSILAKGQAEKIDSRHRQIFKRSTAVIRILIISAIFVVIVADAYVISQIF